VRPPWPHPYPGFCWVVRRASGWAAYQPVSPGECALPSPVTEAKPRRHSFGYHGDDGQSFEGHGTGRPYGPKYGTGFVVGCLYDLTAATISYFVNGHEIGVAFRNVHEAPLYPTVGLNTTGEAVKANFAGPFKVGANSTAKPNAVLRLRPAPSTNAAVTCHTVGAPVD
jgi:hypothetical protein